MCLGKGYTFMIPYVYQHKALSQMNSDPTMGFTTESTLVYDHEFDACAAAVTSLQTVRNFLDLV